MYCLLVLSPLQLLALFQYALKEPLDLHCVHKVWLFQVFDFFFFLSTEFLIKIDSFGDLLKGICKLPLEALSASDLFNTMFTNVVINVNIVINKLLVQWAVRRS